MMAFDSSGNLLVAVLGVGQLAVLGPSGRLRGSHHLPGTFPTNVAFGSRESGVALVTEGSGGQLLEVTWPTPGQDLYQPIVR